MSHLQGGWLWSPVGCKEQEGSERVCVQRACVCADVGRQRGGPGKGKWQCRGKCNTKMEGMPRDGNLPGSESA
jgi:hypothetical protein